MLSSGLTATAKVVHDHLEAQLAELREKLTGKRYRLGGVQYPSLQHMREHLAQATRWADAEIESLTASLQRQEKMDEKERSKAQTAGRKRAKVDHDAAKAAAYEGKIRDRADAIRRQLPRDHQCPYCSSQLGVEAHADHIHPVSKGGLSTVSNMVYACAKCNQMKGDLTLIRFILKFRLNGAKIMRTLCALGKDI